MKNTFGCLLLAAGAASAAPPEQILDRAIGLMHQAREYSIEIDRSVTVTRLDNGERSIERTVERKSFREPNLLWSETLSSSGRRELAASDGEVLRQFSINPAGDGKYAAGIVQEEPLIAGDYQPAGRYRFSALSPLGFDASTIVSQLADEPVSSKKYLGRLQVGGEPCDSIEIGQPVRPADWTKARTHYPQLPPAAVEKTTLCFRVSDGRLLRRQSTTWGITRVNGEYPKDGHLNVRNEFEDIYRYGPALSVDEFGSARFMAAVRGAMGGKAPQAEIDDEWRDRSLPAVDLVTLQGQPVGWEDFHGKVLVVETWFVNCLYCKHAFPYYEKMRAQLEQQGVVFMALNTNETGQQIEEWLEKNGKKFNFLWTRSTEPAEKVREKLKAPGAPDFFVVGPQGKVIASYGGYSYGEGGEDPRLIKALRAAGIAL